MTTAVPSARLGGLYGLYFAVVALSIGWFGPFFDSLGFSAPQIGLAIGVLTGSKIIAPYLWGTLGDLLPNRLRVVQIGIMGATLAASLLLIDVDFIGLCLVLLLFGLFWNAIIAQLDTLTLEYLTTEHHRYSSIRVWGSIGFIVMMLGSGWLFSDVDYAVLPWLIIIGLLVSAMISFGLPARPETHLTSADHTGIGDRLRHLPVLLFFAVAAVNQLTHGPLNVFFTLYVQAHGYTAFEAGQLWALGVFAEVVLFFVLPQFIRSMDLRVLLTVSLVLGSLRWILIGAYPDLPWLLIGLQLLHAFTFGAIHSVSIEFIRRWFPGKLSGRGMALYSGFVFGLGGSLGAMLSGLLWESFGGSLTFMLSGLMTGMAAMIAWFGLKKANLGVQSS
ncbi:MAG: MFS transporter [Litorivicinaceae bacterium]|nr:MFS transporter [Litorivicinaceae bacterium]